MSTEKRRRTITYTDESGRVYTHTTYTKGNHSPGSIPKNLRLVDVHDRAGHLIAVLLPGAGGGPPLLYVHGKDAPRPMLALTESGLEGVMTYLNDDGEMMAGTLGSARELFDVDCPACVDGFPVSAAELRRKAESETSPGRVARLIV